jgi:hypothetical protein
MFVTYVLITAGTCARTSHAATGELLRAQGVTAKERLNPIPPTFTMTEDERGPFATKMMEEIRQEYANG